MHIKGVDVVITGVKRFKGEVEGTKYDSTTVYVETEMNDGANSRGFASAEYKVGDSTVYENLLQYSLPLQAKVDITITTNGKRTQNHLKVVSVINQPAKKAA